jgi:hypothetical protein
LLVGKPRPELLVDAGMKEGFPATLSCTSLAQITIADVTFEIYNGSTTLSCAVMSE